MALRLRIGWHKAVKESVPVVPLYLLLSVMCL